MTDDLSHGVSVDNSSAPQKEHNVYKQLRDATDTALRYIQYLGALLFTLSVPQDNKYVQYGNSILDLTDSEVECGI